MTPQRMRHLSYDALARILFGPFARLNAPEDQP